LIDESNRQVRDVITPHGIGLLKHYDKDKPWIYGVYVGRIDRRRKINPARPLYWFDRKRLQEIRGE